tara:strand:- start:248 stop:946 length:699 start_codon:yes stop_codon:yes gene_type:complete
MTQPDLKIQEPDLKIQEPTTPQLPPVSQEYIDTVFEEISKMQMALDLDPLRFGPSRLNQKVALTRNLLTRCEQLFNSITHTLQVYTSRHRFLTLEFDLLEKDLLANDPEVRAGRNLKSQEAVAHLKLSKHLHALNSLKTTTLNLETLVTVVKTKRSDLRDIQNRLKDQMKLCQEDLSIGRRWGNGVKEKIAAPPKSLVSPFDTDLLDHRLPEIEEDDLPDLDQLLLELDESS